MPKPKPKAIDIDQLPQGVPTQLIELIKSYNVVFASYDSVGAYVRGGASNKGEVVAPPEEDPDNSADAKKLRAFAKEILGKYTPGFRQSTESSDLVNWLQKLQTADFSYEKSVYNAQQVLERVVHYFDPLYKFEGGKTGKRMRDALESVLNIPKEAKAAAPAGVPSPLPLSSPAEIAKFMAKGKQEEKGTGKTTAQTGAALMQPAFGPAARKVKSAQPPHIEQTNQGVLPQKPPAPKLPVDTSRGIATALSSIHEVLPQQLQAKPQQLPAYEKVLEAIKTPVKDKAALQQLQRQFVFALREKIFAKKAEGDEQLRTFLGDFRQGIKAEGDQPGTITGLFSGENVTGKTKAQTKIDMLSEKVAMPEKLDSLLRAVDDALRQKGKVAVSPVVSEFFKEEQRGSKSKVPEPP